MFSRITISLAVAFAVLVVPLSQIDIAKAFPPQKKCCSHMRPKADPCEHCPIIPSSPSSSPGSACCSAQAPCFFGYSHDSDDFLVGIATGRFAASVDDPVNALSKRPPVPPPRAEFS